MNSEFTISKGLYDNGFDSSNKKGSAQIFVLSLEISFSGCGIQLEMN